MTKQRVDLVVLGGGALVAVGVALVWPAAALVVAGLGLAAYALLFVEVKS